MKQLISMCLALGLVGGAAQAEPLLRPLARPAVAITVPETSQRPRVRSEELALFGLGKKRKERRARREAERNAEKGMVCNDPALQGEVVGRVPGKISGCGVEGAIRLRAVSGVALSQHSVMDCTTAQALKTWVETGVKPAVGKYGGGVSKLRVAAHYACRTRNNKTGARISEHGKGRAIDISGLTLADGKEISVLKDWGKGRAGKILSASRKAACGPFGTVLGPGSDRYHDDHFHFDTARYRGGPYCK